MIQIQAWDFSSHIATTVCLQFHHTDPTEKEIEIGNLGSMGWGLARMQKEIDKCVIVCANCHFKIHAGIIKNFAG